MALSCASSESIHRHPSVMPPIRESIPSSHRRKKSCGLVISSTSRSSTSVIASSQVAPSLVINQEGYRPSYQHECNKLKIPKLHPMQKLVIDSMVSEPKRDQFVVAATGSGKSILFELPAILPQAEGKVTIVFIPRVAIIRLEEERLLTCGIKVEARYKKSGPDAESQRSAQNQVFFRGMHNPSTLPSLLLVTPHQLEHSGTALEHILKKLYDRGQIQRFVFDEIHMLLDKYELVEHLANLRNEFPHVPITILSASLSPSTCKDLKNILKLNCSPQVFPLDRPNVFYSVLSKYSSGDRVNITQDAPNEKEVSQLVPILHLAKVEYPKGSGLVYCRSKDACKRMAALLNIEGIPSAPYDNEVGDTDEGVKLFDRWIRNDPTVRVLVSTVALSSGVHKPDVRFVVHTSIPSSGMDGYMQETGRAGRDGRAATCLLLYAFDDAFKVPHSTEYQSENVYALLHLITSSTCRRGTLLSYYNDNHFAYDRRRVRCCDICDGYESGFKYRNLDVTPVARHALSYFASRNGPVGGVALAEKLQKQFRIIGQNETTTEMWKKIVQLLIVQRYLEKDRHGLQGGGQLRLVRGSRTNNILNNSGDRVLLPWPMRFSEYYLGAECDEWPLLWTEDVVRKISDIDEDTGSREESIEL